jgi:predicted benzoate:H+ symporter BenE
MLAMGRALMARPKLLMLDEPSMGLAPMLVEKIFEIIKEINAQGTTILLVEQNANVALEASNCLSLYYRMLILTAWSAPGAAMLVTSVAGVSLSQAIGAFMVCAALIVIVGVTGWFDKAMSRIPGALAAALLARVLLRFGVEAFGSMQTQLVLVLGMFAVYLAARRWLPRYAVVLVLVTALVIVAVQGQLHLGDLQLRLAKPVFTAPSLSYTAQNPFHAASPTT